MEVGDFVVSKKPNTDPLISGAMIYKRAVIVSITPFALVSEDGDMRWSTWEDDRVQVVGHASEEITERCIDRYVRDMSKYL